MSKLSGLDRVTEAVETGAGLPAVTRAASQALHASLAVADASGAVLAVAARSQLEEQALLSGGDDVLAIPLRLADKDVGTLRIRPHLSPHSDDPKQQETHSLQRLIVTMIASEVERRRAPHLASQSAAGALLRDLLSGTLTERDQILHAAGEISLDLSGGGTMIVARARPQTPVEEGWRSRVRTVAERGARSFAPAAVAALSRDEPTPARESTASAPEPAVSNREPTASAREPAASHREPTATAEVLVRIPGADLHLAARAADGILAEMRIALPGCLFALGRSRLAPDAADLPRAAKEALLAANVASASHDGESLSFDDTGAYRLLLSTMSDAPDELHRFYAETVEPLVSYDQQYETDLLQTLETFLQADGNVAGTAQRLFTHRHTIYYRLDRIRELTGLDVSSSDGREKLSLGCKAMRVLGLTSAAGPASEAGAGAGQVPRGSRARR